MSTLVCIGGGRYGAEAVRAARLRGDRVLVVDTNEACEAGCMADAVTFEEDSILDAGPGAIQLYVGEGAATLDWILARWVPDMVVPASRGHMAAYLAMHHCLERGQCLEPLPRLQTLKDGLPPGSVVLSDDGCGVVAVSYMRPGGMCLVGCDQPNVCPMTGSRLASPMHRSIGKALEPAVERSYVLVTRRIDDVGGIAGMDLRSMLEWLDTMEDGTTCGVATACRCHGIMNLFRVSTIGKP